MSSFGALTDHFGLAAGGGALETVGVLIESSESPVAQNRVNAEDENGDVAASSYHGNTEGDLSEVSCTYAIKSGTLNINTLKAGEITVGLNKVVITSIEAATSNGEWPTITVSGTKGTEDITAPTGFVNTFTLPSITIDGKKQAQVMGFTVTEGKLTGSSVTASVDLAQQDDGVGEPVAHGVSGGTLEMSADFVRITDAIAWDVVSPFTETQAPGADEGQAAYHVSSGTGAGILARDTSGV